MDIETKLDANDSTTQIAFADAVAKLGVGDVLKLDCEGAGSAWSTTSGPSRIQPSNRWKACCVTLASTELQCVPVDGHWGFAYGEK